MHIDFGKSLAVNNTGTLEYWGLRSTEMDLWDVCTSSVLCISKIRLFSLFPVVSAVSMLSYGRSPRAQSP